MQAAVLAQALDLALDVMYLRIDTATVYLQLGLAWPARTDAAAKAGQNQALPSQAWQVILELCQLDLQLALTRAGPLGKDIQDQSRTVNDLDAEDLFQIMLLGRRQLIVEDQ